MPEEGVFRRDAPSPQRRTVLRPPPVRHRSDLRRAIPAGRLFGGQTAAKGNTGLKILKISSKKNRAKRPSASRRSLPMGRICPSKRRPAGGGLWRFVRVGPGVTFGWRQKQRAFGGSTEGPFTKLLPGNDLLSHTPTRAVPSALRGLTAVFGMGTGVSPSPQSPEKSNLKEQVFDTEFGVER